MLFKFKHIRYNAAAFMIVLITALLLVVWGLVSFYTNRLFIEQILKDNKVITEKIAIQIDNDLTSVEEYSRNIIYSDEIQSLMRSYYKAQGYKYYSISNEINKKLSKYALLKSEIIYEMYIIEKDGVTEVSPFEYHGDTIGQKWYTEILENEEKKQFSRAYSSTRSAGIPINIISYVTRFNDLDNPDERMGSLIINLNYEAIFSKLGQEDTGSRTYYIIDSENEVVFTNEQEPSGEKEFDYTKYKNSEVIDSDEYIYISLPIEKLNYVLIAQLTKKEISNSIKQIYGIIILFFVLSLIATSALAFPISKKLTEPIIAMSNGMNDVAEGNFERTIQINQENELKEMADSFNNMTYEIRRLLEEIEDSHQKEKEMQIKLFMSRINPHFIYNTLYSIISLAGKEGSSEIANLTKAFINILRRNIVSDEKTISIKDEIAYLDNYIFILKYQYGDMISISYQVDDALLSYKLKPMILYPLVENSIFHGIAPKNEKGSVDVSIEKRGDRLYVVVSDDGIGIEPMRLEEIKDYLKSPGSNGHIGLKSVYDRLKFFYGEKSGFEIASEPGQGTVISFYTVIDDE